MNFSSDPNSSPLTAQKDKNAVTVRWLAHDDNGNDIMFAVWYRGVGEANWRLLKDKISERFLSFDSTLLPDGSYALKVVASDAPVHTDSDALMGKKASGVFVVDTTPPVPGVLMAVMEADSPAKIHGRLEARDTTSPIAQHTSLWAGVSTLTRLLSIRTALRVRRACSSMTHMRRVWAIRNLH